MKPQMDGKDDQQKCWNKVLKVFLPDNDHMFILNIKWARCLKKQEEKQGWKTCNAWKRHDKQLIGFISNRPETYVIKRVSQRGQFQKYR